MPDLLAGGCMCGGVRFEVSGRLPALYCHCSRCRRRTGSAASAQARIDAFDGDPGVRPHWRFEETPPGGFPAPPD